MMLPNMQRKLHRKKKWFKTFVTQKLLGNVTNNYKEMLSNTGQEM